MGTARTTTSYPRVRKIVVGVAGDEIELKPDDCYRLYQALHRLYSERAVEKAPLENTYLPQQWLWRVPSRQWGTASADIVYSSLTVWVDTKNAEECYRSATNRRNP